MKIIRHQIVNSRTDFFYYAFRNLVIISLPIVIVSIVVLSSPYSSASSSLDNLTLSIPVSCTMSSTINTAHSISMVSGRYEENIGKTTLDTTCNDVNGFVVYAIGSSNNEEGNTNLIPTSGLDLQYSIASGTATAGDISNWSMKLASISNGDYTPDIDNNYNTYSIVPTTWTKVAHKIPTTADITKKMSFTTTYAIYLEPTQPAGTYTGQVKYVMLHPSSSAHPTTTLESAFALAGKSKINVTDPITGDTGQYYAMQDMSSSICESTSLTDENNTIRLVDTRDNKLYWVTKLQDGHCWMTQNLDLDLGVKDTALGIDTTVLTSEDTDLNDNSLMGAYKDGYKYENGVLSWTPVNDTINFTGTTVSGWQNSNAAPYSANKTDSTETGHASLGNYYNWSAVIASNNSSSLITSTYNDISNNPKNSICPKGWRLPTISNHPEAIADSADEFARLNYLYNSRSDGSDAGLISEPLYFTKSGYIINSSLTISNGFGNYFSSTINSPSSAFFLRFSNSLVNTRAIDMGGATYVRNRPHGISVRCLTR